MTTPKRTGSSSKAQRLPATSEPAREEVQLDAEPHIKDGHGKRSIGRRLTALTWLVGVNLFFMCLALYTIKGIVGDVAAITEAIPRIPAQIARTDSIVTSIHEQQMGMIFLQSKLAEVQFHSDSIRNEYLRTAAKSDSTGTALWTEFLTRTDKTEPAKK